jgi:DnaK suppressor protein
MPLTADLIEGLRAELERQLARLEKSMSVTEESARPVQLDQQSVGRLSRMDSLQNQHMSRNLQEREQVRYAAIRGALKRIEEGTYGLCTGCGAEIEAGRLLVFPEAERCPECSG